MARPFRVAVAGLPLHVVQRGNNRCAIFHDDRDRRFFLTCLQEACAEHACHVHAYVLMTNHVHILMTSVLEGGIAKAMQSVGTRYVPQFNWRHQRIGTLWQGRYKGSPIKTERYFLACSRYIELNPVRAGMVAHPAHYRWSSYARNALGHPDPLVREHAIVESLGKTLRERCDAYAQLFDGALDDATLETIRDAINKGKEL